MSVYCTGMARTEDPVARFLRGCHLISALSREVLEKGYLRRSGARGISFVQINLLKFIDGPRPRSVGDVMRFMGASFAAASKAVSRLKQKALVRVGRHPGDRRAQIVALTPAGRGIIQRYEKVKFDRVRRLVGGDRGAVGRWSSALEEVAFRLMGERELLSDLCLQCGAYYSDRCLVSDRRCRVKDRPI